MNNFGHWGDAKLKENEIDLEITCTLPMKIVSKKNIKQKMSGQTKNYSPLKYEIEVYNNV